MEQLIFNLDTGHPATPYVSDTLQGGKTFAIVFPEGKPTAIFVQTSADGTTWRSKQSVSPTLSATFNVEADKDTYIRVLVSTRPESASYKDYSGGGGGISQEFDPTVPGWAKQPKKPEYTASEIKGLGIKDAEIKDSKLLITKTDNTVIEFEGGGGASDAHTHEQIVIICSASTFYQWHGLKVIITEDNGKKHELELDETGETIGYVKLGVTYTITFPVVQGLLGHDDMTFTAEHYVRNVKAVYRYQYGDLRDVARSFVVEASSSSLCELTGNEDVIDEILSHGAYVIDENTKKYARLSEDNSGFFADGTPWDGTYGNAFRYLPKIYILHDNNHVSGGQKYWVSNEAMEGTMELPESWIGMYKGSTISGVLRSIPNVFTTENKTMSQFWTEAQQNGKDYGLVNYFDHQKLNALHLAKFGDMNSDNTVGIGLCNAGSGYYNHKTGTTAALGNGTGASQYLSTDFQMVRLFGIEDLFGTTWEFRPNIRFDGSYAIVYEGNIVSDTAEGRQFARLQSASGAYIRNMALGDTFDLVPTNASGASQSTYWCDGTYAANIGQLLLVGGASGNGSVCGLSCANSNAVFAVAYAAIGARLAFKGDISEYSEVSGAELAALQS